MLEALEAALEGLEEALEALEALEGLVQAQPLEASEDLQVVHAGAAHDVPKLRPDWLRFAR